MGDDADLPAGARAVLEFWFGRLDDRGMPAADRMKRWFESDPALDAEIRERFGDLLERVAQLDDWKATARGTLALVILADQFSRNVYRGNARAFDRDPLACSVAMDAIDRGLDRDLLPIERVFLYMPLEHAENLAVQERSVRCFHALADEVSEELADRFRYFASFADRHRDVIARFGRFPHRNAVLGRASTVEEAEYLANDAPTWGQSGEPDRPN